MNKSAPLHNGDADFHRLAARACAGAPRPHPGGPAGSLSLSLSLFLSLSMSMLSQAVRPLRALPKIPN